MTCAPSFRSPGPGSISARAPTATSLTRRRTRATAAPRSAASNSPAAASSASVPNAPWSPRRPVVRTARRNPSVRLCGGGNRPARREARFRGAARLRDAGAGATARRPATIEKGTPLFLASSQAVKRRYRFELPNPRDLRRRFPVEIRFDLSESRAAVSASAVADGHELAASISLEGPFPPARKAGAITGARCNRPLPSSAILLLSCITWPAPAPTCSFPSRSSMPSAATSPPPSRLNCKCPRNLR